jgi:hypothetical protein
VTLAIGSRTRALMIVLVLALAAVGAGMMVLGRSQGTSSAAPETPTKPTPRHSTNPAPTSPAPTPAPSGGGPRETVPAPTPAPPGGALPAAIAQALAANRVVVVALYDPAAKIDGTAVQEASAGAQLAGATFVPVDVTTSDVDALNARYGVIQDPAVLVLRPPGDLVVRIDGFADRDTVAQAAANAAS